MPLLFGALGPTTILILIGLGALLFVKRLPEFGRLFGRSFSEFQRGLHDESRSCSSAPEEDGSLPVKQS
jgi:Sec-independent protein translocase protein TatA